MTSTMLSAADWDMVHQLAAELVVEHRTDVNQIQRMMQYLINYRPNAGEVECYRELLLINRNVFQRSNRSEFHLATLNELLGYIAYRSIHARDDSYYMALILGWIVRMMRYYGQNKSEAREMISKRGTSLLIVDVSTLPKTREFSEPPRKDESSTLPEVRSEDEVDDFANDFLNFLRGSND